MSTRNILLDNWQKFKSLVPTSKRFKASIKVTETGNLEKEKEKKKEQKKICASLKWDIKNVFASNYLLHNSLTLATLFRKSQ